MAFARTKLCRFQISQWHVKFIGVKTLSTAQYSEQHDWETIYFHHVKIWGEVPTQFGIIESYAHIT